MPYKIRKAGDGYKVYGPSGAKSKKPLSKKRAQAQLKALYANTKDESFEGRLNNKLIAILEGV